MWLLPSQNASFNEKRVEKISNPCVKCFLICIFKEQDKETQQQKQKQQQQVYLYPGHI